MSLEFAEEWSQALCVYRVDGGRVTYEKTIGGPLHRGQPVISKLSPELYGPFAFDGQQILAATSSGGPVVDGVALFDLSESRLSMIAPVSLDQRANGLILGVTIARDRLAIACETGDGGLRSRSGNLIAMGSLESNRISSDAWKILSIDRECNNVGYDGLYFLDDVLMAVDSRLWDTRLTREINPCGSGSVIAFETDTASEVRLLWPHSAEVQFLCDRAYVAAVCRDSPDDQVCRVDIRKVTLGPKSMSFERVCIAEIRNANPASIHVADGLMVLGVPDAALTDNVATGGVIVCAAQ